MPDAVPINHFLHDFAKNNYRCCTRQHYNKLACGQWQIPFRRKCCQYQQFLAAPPCFIPTPVTMSSSRHDWPRVSRKKGLVHETCGLGLNAFTVRHLLNATEASEFIRAAESKGFAWQGSGGAAKGEAYRDNHRISEQNDALASALWEDTGMCHLPVWGEIQARLGETAVGLNPNIRIYRYQPGQRFGRHIDESVDVMTSDGMRAHTTYTLLIYLNGEGSAGGKGQANAAPPPGQGKKGDKAKKVDLARDEASCRAPLVGGETVFYDGRGRKVLSVAPLTGLALFHIHGDRCMLHEALEVTQGTKYILRSDVVMK
eukprot:jgi/Mesvir1/26337/Mv22514-RA.1